MRLGAKVAARDLTAPALHYSRAPLARGRTPWRDAAWCALDFELTGLDPRVDEIISFGLVPIDGGRVQLGHVVGGLVKPRRALAVEAIRVHGIREADLANAPALAAAIQPLLHALAGRVLVVHTAAVERAFLGAALRSVGLKLRGPIVDTEVLGRLWLHERDGDPLRPRLGLSELAWELGLPAERPHDALGDALTTAQVFIALASHLDARHGESVRSLSQVSRRLDSIRMFLGG